MNADDIVEVSPEKATAAVPIGKVGLRAGCYHLIGLIGIPRMIRDHLDLIKWLHPPSQQQTTVPFSLFWQNRPIRNLWTVNFQIHPTWLPRQTASLSGWIVTLVSRLPTP